ncbi:hypothetical protein CGRA01v4_02665 [Colletotrichum graminicola]|nr:hypothetical protein CGRA01v4_02665 [Colletotrichum graminicola]
MEDSSRRHEHREPRCTHLDHRTLGTTRPCLCSSVCLLPKYDVVESLMASLGLCIRRPRVPAGTDGISTPERAACSASETRRREPTPGPRYPSVKASPSPPHLRETSPPSAPCPTGGLFGLPVRF